MRIAATADLHWELSPRGNAAARALAARVAELAPDLFILAGDVGEGAAFARGLRLFEGLRCPRLLVPGNHDLWTRDPGPASLELYETHLPRQAAEAGFQMLDCEPYVSPDGRLAVVGSINWYDYSYADPALEEQFPDAPAMYRRKHFPRGRHNDGEYVRLGMPDEEFTARVVERFAADLDRLPASVEQIIAVTHHPPVPELFYPTPLETPYQRFWLAYTGNRRMEAVVRGDPRIRTVLCGHTHAACAASVEGRRLHNLGGDYDFKRLLLLDTWTGEETAQEFR